MTDRHNSDNPYATPRAQLRVASDSKTEVQLATRGRRFAAVLLDQLILIIVTSVISAILFLIPGAAEPIMAYILDSFSPDVQQGLFTLNILNPMAYIEVAISIGVYLLINGILLHKYGQSVGKLALNIKIVDAKSYEILPLHKVILLRYTVFWAVGIISVILGMLVSLVDTFSIFKSNKRMLHDLVAGTIVIDT